MCLISNRAQRPAGKRPPSRRSRGSSSGPDPVQSLPASFTSKPAEQVPNSLFDDFSPPPSGKATQSNSLIDKIEDEMSKETGLFSSKKAASKVTVTVGDDLFGSSGIGSTPAKSDIFQEKSGNFSDLFAPSGTKPASKPTKRDDLFSSSSTGPSKKDDLFTSSISAPSKVTTDSLFDNPPEDVFKAGTKTEANVSDIFASTKEERLTSSGGKGKVDDLFAEPSNKKRSKDSSTQAAAVVEVTDGPEVKSKPDLSVSTEVPVKGEEATKTKKKTKAKASKKVKKTKGRPDEDLFGNTDDIFGDLPVEISKSPKTKRTKKKVTEDPKTEEGSSKAGDPVDLSKPKKAKSVKKKNKKPVEAADLFDSPSIFDDPLNALGN